MSTLGHMAVPLKELNCIIAANLFTFSTICFSSEPAHWRKLYQMHTSVGLPLSFNPVLARSQPLISGRCMVLFPRRETKLPKLTVLPWVIFKPAKSMLKIQWRRRPSLLATGVFFKAHHHTVPSYFLSRWHLLHRGSLKKHTVIIFCFGSYNKSQWGPMLFWPQWLSRSTLINYDRIMYTAVYIHAFMADLKRKKINKHLLKHLTIWLQHKMWGKKGLNTVWTIKICKFKYYNL